MSLTIDLAFSTGFRIGTGTAGRGLDEVIDRTDVLRASSLKGVLRAEARTLLPGAKGRDHPFVEAVFGTERARSPWHFAVTTSEPTIGPSVGIRLDGSGQVEAGALIVKEVASVESATVRVTRRWPLTAAGLPGTLADQDPEPYHLALLSVCARLTDKVGQRRTRGLGWVTLTPADRDLESDVMLVWQVRAITVPAEAAPKEEAR